MSGKTEKFGHIRWDCSIMGVCRQRFSNGGGSHAEGGGSIVDGPRSLVDVTNAGARPRRGRVISG
ncbi:hypothetical protein GCM10010149_34680 [Nonomuraea roseoviolacea subsp. roseoviolacea]